MRDWSDTEADELSPAAREVLEMLLQEEGVDFGTAETIAPRGTAAVELSFSQQRLWFLAQLEPESAVYNVPAALRLIGSLDIAALTMSLGEVVRRHEVLRTAIHTFEGEPLAEVAAADGQLPLPVVDLSALDAEGRHGAARDLVDREVRCPFDLAQAPLLRGTLIVLQPAEHLLLLTMHHIVSDGWSVGVLVREVGALYEACRQGRPSPLPPLPIQYADFAAWQRRRLTGELLDRQLAYWRERLAGAPPVITLPTDRPRPAVQSMRGARRLLRLPVALGEVIDTFSHAEGVTPFMTLVAAVAAWLYRHGAEEDLVIGSPIANRTRAEIEGLIGFFTNTVALRADLSGNPSWRGLLARVREAALGAYEHQDLPFERLVEELAIGRGLSHNPLFQVMAALQNAPQPSLALPGLTISHWEVEIRTARFDLVVDMEEERRWSGSLEYATDLFDAATVERMIGHFERLLAAAVETPGRPLAELPLLTPAESQQLAVEWSDSAAPPPAATLPQLFAAQAARTPSAPALDDGREIWIYEELAARSAELARRLQTMGVEREIIVGLCLDRSVHMVAAALAVLRAGGAYLPLDPTFPAERLEFMAAEAGIRILICDEQHREAVSGFTGVAVTVEELAQIVPRVGGAQLDAAAPDDLAYLLFTSGSTGRPKGVEVPHGALANFLATMATRPGLTVADTLLAVTTLSFDIAGLELFLPLTVGARVVLADRETAADGALLASLLERSGATVMQATPATWQLLLSTGWAGSPHLSAFCGGEALSVELVRLLDGRVSVIWNLYGPTETTIWSAVHAVEPGGDTVPVGRPIANTVIQLLDAAGSTVPAGVPGELYIGGAGLARGYRNRPHLTAERFVPDPFAALRGEPGARLYRTGDLARFRPTGEIEVLGRIDSQVKVRGFRIELGEIESNLEGDSRVARAVVAARDMGPGDRRLVAYIVPCAGAEDVLLDPAGRRERFAQVVAPALRARLSRALPDYMVPALFVPLETLPLTANGKVDRRALPAPDLGNEAAYVAPRDATEEILAGLVGDVLNLDRVSVRDDFFALGGHSLLAMQLMARVRQVFGVELPVRRLFETPTVAGLAAAVAQALAAAAEVPTSAPVSSLAPGADAPLSFAQQLIWLHQQLAPASTAQHLPAAVRLHGRLDVAALAAGLTEVVRRHQVLRTVFPAVSGNAVARVAPAGPVPLPVADLTALPAALRRHVAQQALAAEAVRPFDLTRGPLLRTLLLQLDAGEQILAVTLHHIVADAWSLGLLIHELATLYDAFQAGLRSPLPELPLQYADFAIWQRRWLSGDVLERRLDFWRGRLSRDLPALDLPTDRPRRQGLAERSGRESLRLSAALSQDLRAVVRRGGATLFMALLAAYAALLSRLSGQEQLRIGAPVAGREHSETEGMIGVFIETLVFEVDLAGGPSFLELLARLREAALAAYAHQVPFSELVAALQPEQEPGRAPLFQVLLNMLNVPRQEICLSELTLEALPPAEMSAKFDWTLYAVDHGDEIELALVYDADLFDAARMREVRGQIEHLLEQFVAQPEVPIAGLSLVTDASRLLLPDPAQAIPVPIFEPAVATFLTWAERTPDQPALAAGEVEWSYAELARRAAELAQALVARGVEPGSVVAVNGPRCPDLIVSFLAVMLTGGVLMPLDRKHPEARQRLMLGASRASWVLDVAPRREEDAWMERLPGVEVLAVPLPAGSATAALPRLAADDPAYVFFTSGTSGVPKGVLGWQRSLSHFVAWQREAFRIGPGDRVAQLIGLSFDAMLRDVFLPLTSGATLCLPPKDDLSPEHILPWLASTGVTAFHSVPSVAALWIAAVPAGLRLPALRWVFLSGEPLYGQLVERFQTSFPAARVVNFYGSTETTLIKFFYPVPEPPAPGIQPAGTPLPQTQGLVRNAAGGLCGVGEPGEIVVRTPFRTLGYLPGEDGDARPCFLPNPFTGNERDLVYFSGDRGRYRPDGILEVLGRVDDQVKIRGVRVEPAEVNTVIGRQPEVGASFVMAREDGPGDKRLVAYLVLRPGEALNVGDLRQRLRRQLPDPMVPTAFVALDTLPLSANGKVDRRALPAPEAVQPEAAAQETQEGVAIDEGAPRTAVEEILAALCCELLEIERIDVRADFFDVGMHSLLAIQLFSRVQETFEVELPLHEVFERPTVAGLAERVEEALRSAVRATPMVPVPRSEALPLSFGQQRLWFLHQMEPGSAVYNLARALFLEGHIDPALLAGALGGLVARHESLRTTFPATSAGPVQRIAPPAPVYLPLVDLGGIAPTRARAVALQLAEDELRRPFDLAAGPLLRPLLVRIGMREHLLSIAIHHIITDGQSIRRMVEEIAAFYLAGRDGRPAALPSLPVQYADFAAWQRQWLSSDLLAAELRWWREKLGSSPTVLELPTDGPRPAVRTFSGARRPVALPEGLLSGLKSLSRRQGSTLFMTLLAGFAAVLSRWSSQDDLLVGTPGGGRNRTEVEGLVGFFVNMLVLRVDLAGDPGFADLLARTRTFALEAYRHADLPFEKLVDELLPRRDLAHTPLFQVALMLDNASAPLTLPGLRLSTVEADSGTSQFDLRMALSETPAGIAGFLEYNTDLFAAATVDRLIGHLETFLAAAVSAPEERLSELPLLTAAERAMVVAEWNDTRCEVARVPLMHQLFEERALAAPQAVAVIAGGKETTYAELNAHADRLAQLLRFCGVGPGDMVGVLLDRSAEMITAVLGILKSGAAYVPLETRSPVDRMAWILDTMQVSSLLVGGSRLAALPALAAAVPSLAHAICLDVPAGGEGAVPELPASLRLWTPADLAGFPAQTFKPLADPDDPAYVIFTSGSTGRPKGVMVRHRPVINLIDWVNRVFAVSPADRVLFIASLGFDLSVYDIFGLLAAGGSIRVAVAEEIEDPRLLARALATEPITFWDTAPAALQQLVPWLPEAVATGSGGSLRLVFLSGDWVPLTLPDQVRASFPGAQVIALGGATEATVWSNFYPVGDVDPRWRSIPYGRPIQNARYYVLDPMLHPAPIGVPGDLFIGGDCLATGYAAAPVLTAAQYMPDPFAAVSGAVMYRTGDRARFFGDGNIEFLGRLDQQVKVRGFRIELGEIESVLEEHPAVSAVVAAVVGAAGEGGRPGEQRIAAYLVCRGDQRPDTGELRSLVKERLPEYMMPAAFVFLDSLPLSANGKVDRKSLPRPEWSSDESYVAPQGAVEQALARIWGEVLQRDRVGAEDNFFELGGDSILSIQVVSRAAQEGLALTPRQLFENPTVSGLAAVVRVGEVTAVAQPLAYRGPVPLTPIARWFFAQEMAHPEHFNQALMLELGLESSKARFDAARLAQAWEAVLAHHPALGLRFLPPVMPGESWQQIAGEPATGSFGEIDLSALPAERRTAALTDAAAACQASHDLASGQICRAVLFHVADGEPARLALSLHHLVVDGVSWRLLLEDLETAWHQLAAGRRAAPTPATSPFPLWAERLEAYAAEPAILAQERFWTERVGQSSSLPIDAAAGANTVASAREVSVGLSPEETQALLRDVPRAYRTRINDILLTALVESFAAWTGERRLLVELEGHGREEIFPDLDLTRTFGWFTALYPVRLDLSAVSREKPGEALKAVKEQLRAVPDNGIGYGLLRYAAPGSEAVRMPPRPEVIFNYFGQLDQAAATSRLFRPALESPGPVRHPNQARLHLLEVSARIYGGRLQVTWTYSENRHHRATVETLAAGFLSALQALLAHCLSPDAGGLTPSDFPLARVDQPTLDLLSADGRIEDLYPASPVQEGMIFHSLEDPGSGVYIEQLNLELGGLDIPAFERAFARLSERHPILRTAFVRTESRLLAIVRPVAPVCEHQDWRGLDAAAQRRALAELLAVDRRRGFDLETPPLTRLALLRTGEDTCRCVWTFHHVLLDGWSLPLLLQEIFVLYTAELGGGEPRLPARRPYRDYIAWLADQPLGATEAFWRRTLRGFTAPTSLAVDHNVPETHSADAAQGHGKIELPLGAARSEAFGAFARRHRLTLNTLVQGAWAILLHRYSSESDVVFGVVSSGRSAQLLGIDAMIGMFINTLPFRVRVSPAAALIDWLVEVQESQAEMRQFEYSPPAEVHAWSEVPRGTPLFTSILAFENYPVDDTVRSEAGGGLRLGEAEFTEQTNYPLNVIVTPRGELVLKIVYERSRFDEAGVRRMLGHLESLLDGALAAPAGTLDALPLLSPSEQQQVLDEWNDTAKPCPQVPLVHQLFSAHARRRPQAVAVGWHTGESLTYSEVEAQSNRLAHHLRSLGVGPEVLVAMCMERTPERVVGIIGILKAGGAYVSFDPTYPRERLAFLLDDARAPIVLTQERFRSVLPESNALVITLDAEWDRIAGREDVAPEAGVSPENLAYVVYTSGSTGKPKGVEIPHAGLMNLVRWHQDLYGVTPEDRGTQIASPAFDASIWELWPYLAGGASVHIPDEETRLSSPRMIQWWAEQGITLAYLMTPLAEGVLEEKIPAGLKLPTRALIIGGDRLHRGPDPEVGFALMNHYGPAEYTVTSTVVRVPPQGEGNGIPTIGRPVDNTRIYLLDQHREPVPVAVPGELFVGGLGIARGYLHRPDLTAAKFVPDPFAGRWGEPGARVYQTGDLVRWTADGDMDFLGRLDHQVKVRGLRIELGEIETALGEHPAVREGVVLVREDRPGDRRLVGYFVAAETKPATDELRAFLRERLPDYMVPAAFVAMDALPMTPNGKVDRRALPAPEWAATAAYTPPRNAVEETLAAIWGEVLKAERVGIDDNFFELGGDSILSIQVISRATRAGLRINPRQLFENPTVATLAPLVEAIEADGVEEGPVAGPVALTPVQQRFFALQPVHPEHFNLGLLLEVTPVEGAVEKTPDLLARALELLLRHHDALRMRYVPTSGPAGWGQSIEESASLPWTTIDLGALSTDRREAATADAAAQVQASLDLTVAPPLRAAYFQTGDGADRLLWTIHHLVVDAVSWRILLEDLEFAYRQLARGGEVILPPRTASFQRWAARLAELARSPQTAAAGERWIARFADTPPPLPVDRQDGERTAGSARQIHAGLDAAETQALLKEAPRAYRTQINDLLLTALAAALGRFTGGRRVLFDLEGHGRDESLADGLDISRTVGWFTAINPVVLDLGAGLAEPGETLKSIKEQLRTLAADASAFGLLRYLGEPGAQASLAALPAAEVLFNYLGQLDSGAATAASALVRPVAAATGPQRNPAQVRAHLLEINCGVQDGRFEMVWSYSEGCHHRETVERLAADFLAALRELVAHCLSPQAGGATPSDFPLAGLGQPALDRILAAISAEAPGSVLEDLYPATPAQQGMLFHTLQSPGSGVYIEQVKLTLTGLDVAAFERAWRRVVDRHAILRTAWLWHDLAAPLQAVHRHVDLPFRCEDWRETGADEQEARLTAWLTADRRQGFDVQRPPLLRLTLMRLDETTWRLVWTFHHMLLDGWSMAPLLRDLFTLYAAESTGGEATLEPVRPYRDYIAWLRQQDLAAAEQAWRRSLAGFTAPTPLALERPAVPVDAADDEPGRLLAHLSTAATDGLKAFARRHQLTLNTVMQGCWALLLGRHAGETDVVFGIVTSGRSAPLPGIHGMVGLFLNTLPVRVTMPAGERLAGWLQRLQEEQVELRQYDYTPLIEVQTWSEVPAGRPLFESLFAFENYPIDESVREQAGSDLEISAVEMLEKTNFPLHLIVSVQEQVRLRVFFDRRRFAEEAIARLLNHFDALCASLLASAAAFTDPLLEELSLLGDDDRRLLPDPAVALPEPEFPPVSRLFLERAAEAPDAPALRRDGEVWSYAELRRYALGVARHLTGRGLEPGEVVAVDGSSSFDLIAALLGVLLARGAFLILDRKLPESRRQLLLERSRARRLIRLDSGEAVSWDAPEEEEIPGVDVLSLDSWLLADLANGEETDLADPGPDDPAYVFFTSGTTGTPKAILGRQRGLAHFVSWQRDTFGIAAGDRVAQLTGLAFDVVLRDIFLPLVSGATLCLIEGADRSPERVLPWLAAEEINALHTVPSLASVWLDGVPEGLRLPSLRYVFFAGEPLTDHLVRRWRAELAPESGVVNLYGPTETTLAKCFYRVPDPPAPGVQPVGTAMSSAQALVLAGGRRQCAVGEAGEIVIRTPFRSLGYLDAGEEDRRRFRPNPFSDDAGDLLYFTGDRGRYRADGVLEILGRLDDQVKIRGMRVEPGEVRAVLLRQEGVRECAVIAREDNPGDLRLVAYVVPVDAAAFDAAESRTRLRSELPDYMVPAAIMTLTALPLTPNGKLDRRALPAPEGSRAGHLGRYVAPRDRTEVELVAIWEELLKVSPVGVHDDFFELGGHSLLAMRLVSMVQERFKCNLPLATLLAPGNIEEFAALLQREGGAHFNSPVVPLHAAGSRPRFFCVHPGGGGVLCYRDLAQRLGPDQPFFAFQSRGLDGAPIPEETRIEDLAQSYVEAMRLIQPKGPYLLGGWSFGGKIAFEMARQLEAAGDRCAALVLIDAPAPGAFEIQKEVDLVALAAEVGVVVDEEELQRVAPEERIDYLAGLAAAGGMQVDVEQLRRLFAVYMTHHLAGLTYEPAEAYSGPVVILRARERANDLYPGITAGALDYGWGRFCSAPPAVLPVPGTHLTMVRPPHVETLAAVISHVLADVAEQKTVEATR
jgi:amino acid adenylation domain-containing protein/non-ribosomal peptide synthase protein (TIGR01720 family)